MMKVIINADYKIFRDMEIISQNYEVVESKQPDLIMLLFVRLDFHCFICASG